jgi:hypothetical protein
VTGDITNIGQFLAFSKTIEFGFEVFEKHKAHMNP